jgi:hypothetical protein
MRKTLLIAAAALASSVISSQAGVYSQNIVGYANVPAQCSKNALLACPFTIGVSNGVNEVFGSSLPDGTEVLLWNGAGFTIAIYDSTDPIGAGTSVLWYNGNESAALTTLPTIPPGSGFFLVPYGPSTQTITNVFAGAVAINVGTSNNMPLVLNKNNFVGCVVPYAGAVTNGNNSTGGPNLNNLPNNSELLFWNGAGYNIAQYDNSDPIGDGTSVLWYNGNESAAYVDPATGGNTPTISVGQGFIVIPVGVTPYTWTTGL